MQAWTLVLIFLSAILAGILALYQYGYKVKKMGRLNVVLAFLRFLSFFGLFILLINPRYSKETYTLVKSNLILLLDNSSSLKGALGAQQSVEITEQLQKNTALQEQFNVARYSFGNQLETEDSLTFSEGATNISRALATLNTTYANTSTAVVMLTDGNQTLGEDYEFYGRNLRFPVYPIALGDTTKYEDLRINQVNLNKYAFLKNKFPVEVYLSYEGLGSATTMLTIALENKVVHRERLSLTPTANSKVVNTLLTADSVGIKNIKISLSPLANERNTGNNQRIVAVEVIDEKTRIALVADILHPDLGTLKKAIESNEQRSLSIISPNAPPDEFKDIDLYILYQPNTAFTAVYDIIKEQRANSFTITGTQTDWHFLNNIQDSFEIDRFDQTEELLPILNPGFSLFDITDFSVNDFPPLIGHLGEMLIPRSSETLLGKRVKGVDMNEPLLAIIGGNSRKEVVLFGEHLWKWRIQSFRNEANFANFDAFIGKLVRYLTTNQRRSRLSLDYNKLYPGSSEAVIRASYFDETYVFDGNANIVLTVQTAGENGPREIPMLLKQGYYEADLSDLPAGNYTFNVRVEDEDLTDSGSFSILDFDVEQQLLSTDYQKLKRLAQGSGGESYFPSQTGDLIRDLTSNTQYLPTQRSEQKIVSLIDFQWLLALIVIALASEWFIRKYNGLI